MRIRDMTGYFLLMIVQTGLAVSSLAYGIELITSDIDRKLIYVFFRYLGSYMVLLGTFFFSLWYTGRRGWLAWRRAFFISLPAWFGMAAIATNSLHHLYYPAIWLVHGLGVPQIAHSVGPFYYLITVYVLGLILATLYIFISCQLTSPRIYNPGIALVTGGYFIMVFGYLLYLSGFRPFGFINMTYFFSTINSIALTIAVLRYSVHSARSLGYEALIRELPIGVILFDRDMLVVEINPAAKRMLSYDDMVMKSRDTLPDIFLQNQDIVDLCAIRGTGAMEIRIGGIDLLCTVSEIRDQLNEIAGTSLTLQDITEKKCAEESLKKSEEKHRMLIENSHDIIYTISPEGIFNFVSPGWTELLGYPVDEVVGNAYRLFVHPDDIGRCEVFLHKVIETGQKQTGVEYRVRHANGSWRWHTSNAVPLKDETGKVIGFEGSASDIDDHKKAEEQLQNLNVNLQKRVEEETERRLAQERLLANQARMAAMGKMIGAIAHQWRQPLSTLGMIVQRFHAMGIMNDLTREQLDEFKNSAMYQIRYMSDTIDEFRNFYRQEKQRESFLPHNIIADAVRLFATQFKSRNIVVDLVCPEEARRTVNGYPNEFKQVVLNLLGNARDAILDCRITQGEPEDGSIVVDIGINSGKIMIISISDNGCGIPDDVADQIFDPYFTTKEDSGGTGIGLYMSRMIMEESLGGKLSFLQNPKGATFRIELPIEENT